MNKKTVIFSACLAFCHGAMGQGGQSTGDYALEKRYQDAVIDASRALPTEISPDLFAINEENERIIRSKDSARVLVTTWKSQEDFDNYLKPYDKTSDNEQYVVWVTAAPQVQQLCHRYLKQTRENSQAALDLRLKQYLGLKHTWDYDVFVEMWVSPDDLFRPCVDPETDDAVCNLDFQATIPDVKRIEAYDGFYKNLYYKSFRSGDGAPWTGLGYAYDWGNPSSEVGASEYILSPGSPYEIKRVMETMAYCKTAY